MNTPMSAGPPGPPTSGPPSPPPPESTGPNARVILVVLAGLMVMGVLVAVLLVSGGGDGGSDTRAEGDPGTTTTLDDTTSTEPTSSPTQPSTDSTDAPIGDADPLVVGPDTADLARAAVLLLQLDGQGDSICFSGSGSVVAPAGQILTNAHVVWNDPTCPYEQLGVAFVEATDEPPTLRYLADIVAYDELLDLAVVQISTDVAGDPVGQLELPYVALGDSGGVDLGDSLRILGFPGIGGDTITFTRGAVSGFVAERGVDATRAWIKTDATIAAGNSGGMAVNEVGQLVGIPTTAGAGDAATTDCRVIEDTNGDGFIDDGDGCIPIGGFINGLRPVNLALPLIADAAAGEPIRPASPQIGPATDFNTDDVVIENIYFAPDVTEDDQPTAIVTSLPSGVDRVCVFWTYSGMQDGLTYDAIWRVDGTPDADTSFVDDIWAGGDSGEWWVCAINDTGIADGLYEFEFSVEGEFLASEAMFVGGDRQAASITVANESADTICYVQISPSLSGYWGSDELGEAEVIDAFASRVFDELVTGQYDVILRDCDLNPLDEWTGINVTGDEILVHDG